MSEKQLLRLLEEVKRDPSNEGVRERLIRTLERMRTRGSSHEKWKKKTPSYEELEKSMEELKRLAELFQRQVDEDDRISSTMEKAGVSRRRTYKPSCPELQHFLKGENFKG